LAAWDEPSTVHATARAAAAATSWRRRPSRILEIKTGTGIQINTAQHIKHLLKKKYRVKAKQRTIEYAPGPRCIQLKTETTTKYCK
jgi:hypothetical protein